MSEPFLGMIALYPYNFAPRGWAFCNGQILPIAQNTALFSLIGTTFGGNGQTTFALPPLHGRVPNSSGQGPGLSNYDLGQAGGTESATLTVNQLAMHSHWGPAHTHGVTASGDPPADPSPSGDLLATFGRGVNTYAPPSATTTTMATDMIQSGGNEATSSAGDQPTTNTGGNQPVEILQPYLTLNHCIALEGIFPSRNQGYGDHLQGREWGRPCTSCA